MKPQPRKRLRNLLVTPQMKARLKEAQEARQEFYDTIAWSDGWLVAMLVTFSTLGNLFPPRRKINLFIGGVLFFLCFLVYLRLKSSEDAAKKAAAEGETEPLQQKKTCKQY
mmetsp:Transcript_63528/g.113029  ORF Transcript_63528/g.113029 Transcript_63528/m.113029 type:complete len:111 (+) Transcript_63528:75-407(+)